MELPRGSQIKVFDGHQVELGEGTLCELKSIPEMNLTVYECEEHTILARGVHWVEVGGKRAKRDGKSGSGTR